MTIQGKIRLVPSDLDLAEWRSAWDLQDLPSPHLRCRVCGAMQTAHERNIGFMHHSDCDAFFTSEQLPWRDLMWILENISSSENG